MGAVLPLSVGSFIYLTKKGATRGVHTTILGWREDVCIIVDLPKVRNLSERIKVNQVYISRYIHEGVIFEFETKVIETSFRPIPIVFLSYPAIARELPLRKYKRYKIFGKAKLYSDEKGGVEAELLDISKRGVGIKSKKEEGVPFPFEKDEGLFLDLFLPDGTGIEKIPVSLRNIKEDEKDIKVGLSFIEQNEDVEKFISNWFKE